MKASWELMSKNLKLKSVENQKLIEKLNKQNYKSKLNKIGNSEYIGTLVCYLAAAYLGLKLPNLDEPLMQIFALISILLLFVLPIISLKSVRGLSVNMDFTKSHIEVLQSFTEKRIRFQKLQKLNVSLALFLMVIILPVLASIKGTVLSEIPNFWTLIFPIGVAFFLGFAYWVLRFYDRTVAQMEGLLKEISD